MLKVVFLNLQDEVVHLRTEAQQQTQHQRGGRRGRELPYLDGRYHGAECKDGGVVLDRGEPVEGSLRVQQQHCHLQRCERRC